MYHLGSRDIPLSNVNNLFLESQGEFLRWYIVYGAWVSCLVLWSTENSRETWLEEGWPELTGVGTHLSTSLFPDYSVGCWQIGFPVTGRPHGPCQSLGGQHSGHNGLSVSFWAKLRSGEDLSREKALPVGSWQTYLSIFRTPNPHSIKQKPWQTSPRERSLSPFWSVCENAEGQCPWDSWMPSWMKRALGGALKIPRRPFVCLKVSSIHSLVWSTDWDLLLI